MTSSKIDISKLSTGTAHHIRLVSGEAMRSTLYPFAAFHVMVQDHGPIKSFQRDHVGDYFVEGLAFVAVPTRFTQGLPLKKEKEQLFFAALLEEAKRDVGIAKMLELDDYKSDAAKALEWLAE